MKYVVILGVAAVLVAGFAYFSLFGGSPDAESTADRMMNAEDGESLDSEAETVAMNGSGTFMELLERDTPVECTINYETPETGAVEGTLFVNEGELRGDFLVPSPDLEGTMLSSMIVTSDTVYVWSEFDGEAQGVQIALGDDEGALEEANTPVDPEMALNYDCAEWQNVDRSVFTPPSDVLFLDFDAAMQGGMEYGTVYEEGQPVPEMP